MYPLRLVALLMVLLQRARTLGRLVPMDIPTTQQPRILVVDDDASIAALVADTLVKAQMDTTVCHSADEALAQLAHTRFDLALLDVMMPGMDGLELCARIRQTSDLPVIFLTAKDAEEDLVVGFALGAADYIVKPFRPRELVVRVKARLRTRDATARAQGTDVLVTQDFEVDRRAHVARLHGTELDLTPKEFSILTLLAENIGSPVPARELFERVWKLPWDPSASNTVMVHIRHLRKKCSEIDSSQTFIDTVWGVGYRMRGGRVGGTAS